ncbi:MULTISPECIES: UDP-N-acetylglucosamine 2-epimerase (non-hydrolyzing) [unclassified Corynebacterium]|uniref:non-hydrolyzing UDP-N-acetylglucosamine 2-epimerase n=1 Tax=unclassified Corynebacterium TaxID=2624378 RepID=UPI0008A5981B|nr:MULTISPECIES: UDP-N-acetylglucosamine 2-epimerase (non-hydrolyzing) [unclassified Corynebacterium]OFP16921.1 UDP-N-acetyl glucosamine 2-epimerase [Corynebacterium sp. HMSC065A05]OFP67574.1 UDP-N-acetyl glucosamine 2-epimerase [Corynebacterium sp. HMSC077D10]
MKKPKIMVAYGTRPEAIKLAPLIKTLKSDKRFVTCIVSTGQHQEMLNQVNVMFGIEPDFDLSLMHKKQPLNRIMSRALKGLDKLLERIAPDILVVQGDTTTAMAAAIAGFNRHVKVVHLEAGLRSGDMSSPFPEEANRRLITTVASLHLAPTHSARSNLLADGVNRKDIVVTGNTVIDALHEAATWDVGFEDPRIAEVLESGQEFIVVTTHRRENLDSMEQIGHAISRLAKLYPNYTFILPVHLNPVIRKNIAPQVVKNNNVLLSAPLPYDQFTHLLAKAKLIITDSGGVQEEAPALGIPVILMRNTSERPEAIEAGTVRLVGSDEDVIVGEVSLLLDDDSEYKHMSEAINPYGDGRAAYRSVAAIAELTGVGTRVEQFTPQSLHGKSYADER